mmetsp:Transcript_36849/g.59709  ORF Transcript_36849/g.59709 Transcript_36849/m.59709 type:complete len:94 (+) Transcript_36849:2948-3229(+)
MPPLRATVSAGVLAMAGGAGGLMHGWQFAGRCTTLLRRFSFMFCCFDHLSHFLRVSIDLLDTILVELQSLHELQGMMAVHCLKRSTLGSVKGC